MKQDLYIHAEIQDVEPSLGHLIGEFPDFRAGVLQGLGAIMAVLGAVVLAATFLSGGESLATFGAFGPIVIAIGAATFSLGTWRRNKRVSVYTGGFVIRKWGKTRRYFWQDIEAIALDQALYSHHINGLPYFVTSRNNCMVQQKNGVWISVSFPLLSREAYTALHESWQRWRSALPNARTPP